MAKSGRYFNLDPTRDNFSAIWTRLHALDDLTASHATTISDQAALITTLQTQLAAAQAQAKKALLATTLPAASTPSGTPTTPPPSGGDVHPNHLDLITQAKNELVALGEDLSGSCGAFKIVQRAVPWIQASDPTAGYLSKPSGNNCNGFAVDIVCYSDGVIYDVLGDAGGANTPQWSFAGTVDPGRYRAST